MGVCSELHFVNPGQHTQYKKIAQALERGCVRCDAKISRAAKKHTVLTNNVRKHDGRIVEQIGDRLAVHAGTNRIEIARVRARSVHELVDLLQREGSPLRQSRGAGAGGSGPGSLLRLLGGARAPRTAGADTVGQGLVPSALEDAGGRGYRPPPAVAAGGVRFAQVGAPASRRGMLAVDLEESLAERDREHACAFDKNGCKGCATFIVRDRNIFNIAWQFLQWPTRCGDTRALTVHDVPRLPRQLGRAKGEKGPTDCRDKGTLKRGQTKKRGCTRSRR